MYVCILLTWGAPSLCWVLPWTMIIWDALVKKQHKQPAAAAMMMMVVVFANQPSPLLYLLFWKVQWKLIGFLPFCRERHTHICMWLLLMAFWIACCSRPLFLMLPGCLPSFLELPLPLPLPLMKCERERENIRREGWLAWSWRFCGCQCACDGIWEPNVDQWENGWEFLWDWREFLAVSSSSEVGWAELSEEEQASRTGL